MSESSRYIARHVAGLPRSGIRDFFALVSQMKDGVSLGVGEPDFVTPWHIREAAIFALERGKTSYTANLGLIDLRRAISEYVERKFALSYNPENQILVTTGVSEALDIACRAILDPGDKVLYHDPCYVSYSPSIQLCHAEAVPITTRAETAFTLEPEALEAAWQPGCKALLLNFPTNPTGGVLDDARRRRIAKFCVEKDLLVLADDIYAELTYEGHHTSIASEPGMEGRTIFLHGVSKAFAMTGFRLGYAAGPKELVEAMMKVHQYSMLCAPILSQEAAIEAFRRGDEAVAHMQESYHRRRDFLVRRFNELGLACHNPGGTFYTFPNVESTGLDEVTFCTRLLQEQQVAVVPGTAFGKAGKGFVRACFATAYDKLIDATDRLEKFLEGVK